MSKKTIKFMDTSFRDGFQSVFGARVSTDDFLPAVEATIDAGIYHLEAGGGARFQSLFFYCQESAFDMMDRFRSTAGPDANLQTLARGINVVALSQQPRDIIDLHAKMFKKHGMTTIRNFDALNDVRNLRYSGERIVHHGLKHQIVITVMELPPGCQGAHTADFYIDCLKEILDSAIPFDSICFKDASGTANPRKIHETFKRARAACPEDTILWFHTHDTAGIGIQQYIAAIEGGADGIDLSKSPVSGGTAQPDILSMIQVLKGTDYTLDIDVEKLMKAEEIFENVMDDYFFPPEAKMTSPKIVLSPMPGGALTANTMMMRDTQTLHLYGDVIKEMTEVVRLGGFGSSVTPVSQFYFQQAYLNVTLGRWKKINPSYGNMVLGYFGKTPVEPDPELIKLASEQLGKPVFKDDPLDVLEPGIPKAVAILKKHDIPATEENIFIVASCEDKGIDFLKGKGKLTVRKKKKEEKTGTPIKINVSRTDDAASGQSRYSMSINNSPYDIIVGKGNAGIRQSVAQTGFRPVSAAPQASIPKPQPTLSPTKPGAHSTGTGTEVKAQIPGKVLKLNVAIGEQVQERQILLVMEAMKMETDITAPRSGIIKSILVNPEDAVQTDDVLVTIE